MTMIAFWLVFLALLTHEKAAQILFREINPAIRGHEVQEALLCHMVSLIANATTLYGGIRAHIFGT